MLLKLLGYGHHLQNSVLNNVVSVMKVTKKSQANLKKVYIIIQFKEKNPYVEFKSW